MIIQKITKAISKCSMRIGNINNRTNRGDSDTSIKDTYEICVPPKMWQENIEMIRLL